MSSDNQRALQKVTVEKLGGLGKMAGHLYTTLWFLMDLRFDDNKQEIYRLHYEQPFYPPLLPFEHVQQLDLAPTNQQVNISPPHVVRITTLHVHILHPKSSQTKDVRPSVQPSIHADLVHPLSCTIFLQSS
jgi:hypothetical protein